MRKFCFLSCLLVLALAGCGKGTQTIYDTISPTPTQSLDAGQQVTFTATVMNDPSNAGVTWALNGAGTLVNETPTSALYIAPATVNATSTGSVTATPVKNSLFVAATQILLAPGLAVTSSTLTAAVVGTMYSYQLGASGGTGTLTWSIASGTLPAGLSLSSTGLISGTPTAVTTANFSVQVTDSATVPATAVKALTLGVTAPKLMITTVSLPNGVTGTAYSAALEATGGITPYSWSLASGSTLPAGMVLSTAGVISGTPSTLGLYTFTIAVTDTEPSPQIATKTFTITVYQALTITTASLPSGWVKNTYSATLTSSGGTAPVTWALTSGSSLPAGLSLTTAGVISGTPSAPSTTTVSFTATDASSPVQSVTKSLTLTIVLSTLAITTTTVPQATDGVTYSTTLASSGGNAPVTWALAAGSSLPSGLSLSSAGVISGTTTVTPANYSFMVQATDPTPATVSQTLTLTVVGLAALTISTTTVPATNVGTAYSTTLVATGGATPYTWTVASGSLPPGLGLSTGGVLSGIPLAAGSYTFTAQVRDSQGTPATASRSFTQSVGLMLGAGAGNAMLSGSYAFLLQGFNTGSTNGTAYGFAAIGSLTANGSGAITGVEDVNEPSGAQSAVSVTGTYSLGSDGRGLMVLTHGATTNVFAIAASNLSGSVAQNLTITEFDNSTGASGTAVASGVAKLQTVASFAVITVKGAFAFGLSGESPCSSCATSPKFGPLAAAGMFSVDGVSAISAGAEDAAAYGTNYSGVTFTGTFTTPSASTGRGTLHLTNTGTLFAAPPVDYTYVIVDANEMLLMSNDSHATTSLLAGDARLQTVASYTSASLSGALIGYESQGNGGDGATVYPAQLNAILSRVAITGSGTATLAQDANRAGVLSTATATAITYTTATNGRTVLVTGGASNQVLYPYSAGAGFAVDLAATSAYPALVTYEQQVAVAPYPPLLNGNYGAMTLPTAAPATEVSEAYVFALSTGGVNSGVNGSVVSTLDSSAPSGTLALGATNSLIYVEDATGRLNETVNGSSTTQGVVYAISSKRAAVISATTSTTPTVTIVQ